MILQAGYAFVQATWQATQIVCMGQMARLPSRVDQHMVQHLLSIPHCGTLAVVLLQNRGSHGHGGFKWPVEAANGGWDLTR